MDKDDTRSLAYKLRKCRLSAGLSQKQIAQALGLDRSAYSCYERGTSMPNIQNLQKLADIFHLSPAQLLPGNDLGITVSDMKNRYNPIYMLTDQERSVIVRMRALDPSQRERLEDFLDEMTKEESDDTP